jgi:hypothetical protein
MTPSRNFLPAALAAAFLMFASLAHAQDAGSVQRVTGTASIVNAANQSRPVRSGEAIQAGETVTTENGGEVMLKMRDDSTLLLRPNTQLKVSEFRYEQKESDSFFASLVKGSVRAVTGLVGKSRPANVKFSTATATVGIRGTDFELAVVPEGGPDRAGTYNYVYDGGTSVQIASGQSIDVKPEQTGLAVDNPRPGEAPLQLLDNKPAFLRGGGFDALILNITGPQIMIPRMR